MNRFPSVPSVSDFIGPMLCPYCDLPLAETNWATPSTSTIQWWELPERVKTPTRGWQTFGRDPEGVETCGNSPKGCGSGDMFWAFHAMSEEAEEAIEALLKAVKRGQSWRVEPLARRIEDISDGYVKVDKWDLELLKEAADTPLEEWPNEHPEDCFVEIVDGIDEKLLYMADGIRCES